MINLFNMDIDQIKHNNDYVILMKLNGDIVYENIGYCVEYTVDRGDVSLDAKSGGSYVGLPELYVGNSFTSNYNYEKIKIIKTDGTVTNDPNIICRYVSKVMIWFPKETYQINFDVFSLTESISLIKTVKYYDTSNFTSMYYMFSGCDKLVLVNSEEWDTSNVTDMRNAFYKCKSLTILDTSNFDTSNVTDMHGMFGQCELLTTLDLSNFDTSKVTNMNGMFRSCASLTTLDLSNFDTSNVTDMSDMFNNCESLTTLDLSNFDISNVTDISGMFYGCDSLTTLDLSAWDVSHITDFDDFIEGCDNLTNFRAPKNISEDISVNGCYSLTYTSIMSIINNLATVTSTKTLELSSEAYGQLNGYDIYKATQKGWTVRY